ncbi:MAG: lysylphosphatidylglycerol synthase transmembrane domain-containing protein [Candidatus Hodarchaeota archaeon]
MGFLLVGIWVYIVDFEEMLNVFKKMKISCILPLVIFFIIMYFLRSLRWKIILSPIENITVIESFNLCMTNYFINFLIPVHAGELAKSMLLKKMKGTPVSKSLPSIYIDKATDLLPILLLLIMAPFLKSKISSVSYIVSGICLFLLLFFMFILIFIVYKKNTALIWIEKTFFFLPDTLKIKLKNFFALLIEGLSSISRLSNRLLEIIGLTILAVIINCYFMWLFFYAFGVEVPILTILIGYLLLNASFILPAPPGFSGSLELTFVIIFTFLFGYDKNLISAIAVSSHVFIAILFGLFGLSSMALIGTKLSRILKIELEKGTLKN